MLSIDKSVENAIASVEIEGYKIEDECVLWCKKLLENEISLAQYISLVKQKSGAGV